MNIGAGSGPSAVNHDPDYFMFDGRERGTRDPRSSVNLPALDARPLHCLLKECIPAGSGFGPLEGSRGGAEGEKFSCLGHWSQHWTDQSTEVHVGCKGTDTPAPTVAPRPIDECNSDAVPAGLDPSPGLLGLLDNSGLRTQSHAVLGKVSKPATHGQQLAGWASWCSPNGS